MLKSVTGKRSDLAVLHTDSNFCRPFKVTSWKMTKIGYNWKKLKQNFTDSIKSFNLKLSKNYLKCKNNLWGF